MREWEGGDSRPRRQYAATKCLLHGEMEREREGVTLFISIRFKRNEIPKFSIFWRVPGCNALCVLPGALSVYIIYILVCFCRLGLFVLIAVLLWSLLCVLCTLFGLC